MDLRQGNRLQSLKEIQVFLDQNQESLSGIVQSGARRTLDDVVAQLTELAVVQSASRLASKSTTRKVRGLTKALVDHHMAPIARIAAAELPPAPEHASLTMPVARETGERLVALARGMAIEAGRFQSTFVHAGLPDDFIEQLRAATDALAASLGERKQRQGDRGSATKRLGKQLSRARKLVEVLDSFVKTRAQDNPTLLANWKIVKRVKRTAAVPKPLFVPTATASLAGGAE